MSRTRILGTSGNKRRSLIGFSLGLPVAALMLAIAAHGGGSHAGTAFAQTDGDSGCPRAVDVGIVFDHTASMSEVAGKIANAKAAAIGFVDTFAGGPADNDLSPHSMSLTGFTNGSGSVDVAQGTDAAALRTAINGYTTSGYTHIARGLYLGQGELSASGASPDYMVLLSDGAANRPDDVDDANSSTVNNDLYLDVNDNGVIDADDDLSVDFDGGDDATADFVVVDGLLMIDSAADRREALNATDDNEAPLADGALTDADDYDFGADTEFTTAHPGVTPNFRIIDGTLFLDANGDGTFTTGTVNTFTAGHSDELVMLRNGSVSDSDTSYSGDGADVYAQYWATQLKSAGTYLYVIGYELGGSQDGALLQAMASPGGYFTSGTVNIDEIFHAIAQEICPLTPTSTATATSTATSTNTPEPTATKTPEPTSTSRPHTPTNTPISSTATPVQAVAGAVQVPPTHTTEVLGVVLPDTGTGTGTSGNTGTQTEFALALGALAVAFLAFGIRLRRTTRR